MDWISSLLLATVRLAIPVLLISLAELYGQRAGMVNIGLEGLASIGALVGFLVCYVTGSNWLGLLCGALAGVIVNMIYAFSTVTLCADHTVYGMALNIFAPALASFIYRVYFGTGSDLKQITTMSSVAIPGLNPTLPALPKAWHAVDCSDDREIDEVFQAVLSAEAAVFGATVQNVFGCVWHEPGAHGERPQRGVCRGGGRHAGLGRSFLCAGVGARYP